MRILISNVFGFENRGDASLVRALQDEILQAFGPDTELYGISLTPGSQARFLPGIDWSQAPGKSDLAGRTGKRLQNAWRLALALALVRLGFPSRLAGLLPAAQRKAIEDLRDADLVVGCAGGFLHDGNVSIYPALAQLAIAQAFGTPVVLAPQTIGPFRTAPARAWARRVLDRCRFIFYREDVTAEILDDLGLDPAKRAYFPDLALFDTAVDHAATGPILKALGIAPDEGYFCVTCVDWMFPGDADPVAKQADYEAALARAITRVQAETGLTALILNQVSTDMAVNRRVAAQVPGKVVIDTEDRMPDVMRGLLERGRCAIASRFHSCIFALMARRGVQAISYIHKTDGIMARLGLSHRVHPIGALDADRLAEAVLRDLADPEAARAEIDAAMAGLAQQRFAGALRDAAEIA